MEAKSAAAHLLGTAQLQKDVGMAETTRERMVGAGNGAV
jgi:hypothetical protein